jgi:hypothetical protein
MKIHVFLKTLDFSAALSGFGGIVPALRGDDYAYER